LRTALVLLIVLVLVGCQAAPKPGPTHPAPSTTATGPAPTPNLQTIEVEFHPIVVDKADPLQLPNRYSVYFGMLAHSNGRIYIGTCYHVSRLIEFDPRTKRSRVVAMMSSRALHGGGPQLKNPTLLGDLGTGEFPMTRWTHGQDKIHAQLHEGRGGRVYGCTHVKVEDPNATRKYPGGHWFAYDPKTGKTEDLGWARRHEGIITACYDRDRNVLYGITWPTGYLVSCKPDEGQYYRRLAVLGLACSGLDCSPRYFDVARNGRVYMPDGATGNIRVYDPKLGWLCPVTGMTTPFREQAGLGKYAGTVRATGKWRNWWMNGVRSPDGMHLYVTSQRGGRLVEIDATQGRWGAVIDHGRVVPWGKSDWGGPWCYLMVFGRDGRLYHANGKQLLTFDPTDGRVLDWGRTVPGSDPGAILRLGSGGVLGKDGKIYAVATYKKRRGIAVLDPATLKGKTPKLLRISPRRRVTDTPLPEPEAR